MAETGAPIRHLLSTEETSSETDAPAPGGAPRLPRWAVAGAAALALCLLGSAALLAPRASLTSARAAAFLGLAAAPITEAPITEPPLGVAADPPVAAQDARCATVQCLVYPTCPAGEEPRRVGGDCCYTCQPSGNGPDGPQNPDCSMVKCAVPLCENGHEARRLGGGCCNYVCLPPEKEAVDCSQVMCVAYMCAIDDKLVKAPGQCCPKCVPR